MLKRYHYSRTKNLPKRDPNRPNVIRINLTKGKHAQLAHVQDFPDESMLDQMAERLLMTITDISTYNIKDLVLRRSGCCGCYCCNKSPKTAQKIKNALNQTLEELQVGNILLTGERPFYHLVSKTMIGHIFTTLACLYSFALIFVWPCAANMWAY